MIELKYLKECEPQSEGVGNKYLLFCLEDTVLKKNERVQVETGVLGFGGIFRINPLNITYVKYDFNTNKTVFVEDRNRFIKVRIECRPIVNHDIIIKKGTPLAEIEGINESFHMQEIDKEFYNKYK